MAIAEAIAADIASGRLCDGARMPTHRGLARLLQVTIGTVTRAYAEAERRGLIAGEIGRGTFVRAARLERFGVVKPAEGHVEPFVDLSRNVPAVTETACAMVERHLAAISRTNACSLISGGPTVGRPAHREAGADWIARRLGKADPARVVIVNGAQHGLMLALAARTRPGDVVLSESLAFYGVKSACDMLGLRLAGVEIDAEGIVPDSLEAACRLHAPRALYTVPTFQSPTTSVMPFARREMVVAICRRYGVTIVEDDIFGFLDESSVPLAALAPELCVYITSLSKSFGGGMRLGYLYAGEAVIERVAAAIRATTMSTMPLAAELAARLIRDGDALQSAKWQRNLAIRRSELALRILAGTGVSASHGAPQAWLPVPERWSGDEFAEAVRAKGVGVTPGSAFAVGRSNGPHGVRIALCAHENDRTVAQALGIVAGMLGTGSTRTPDPALAVA
jgi:DNA-binding transcriptional MocR family regulator